jgi:peroxiredoxin
MWQLRTVFVVAVTFLGMASLFVASAEEGGTSPAPESSLGKIAPSAETTTPLKVGDQIPAVTVKDREGDAVALRERVMEQASVLVFYRGGWCPYCNTHLGKLALIEKDLADLGFQILAIAPDKPEILAETGDKADLGYTLLSDADVAAAKAFGLAFKVDDATVAAYQGYGIDLEASSGQDHHALPVPAVYVADKTGTIRFVYANADYKERLDNGKLMDAAKEAAS